MRYLKVIEELLKAVSNENTDDMMIAANEILNLVMDKVQISEFEKETAEYLAEELELEIEESKYEHGE